ncbi:MAG: PmbA/TldA family metallopeptidase, partial [Sphingomicrobium sp.]
MLNTEDARRIANSLVERAIAAGATAADALYAGSCSSNVEVRLGELDSVSRSEGEQIGLRMFVGQRSATVASSDLSDDALGVLVDRCLAMASEAPEDPFAGLVPEELLQRSALDDLDSEDRREPDPAELRARALVAEAAALAVSGVTNSSGVSASVSASTVALATSGGFSGGYRSTG